MAAAGQAQAPVPLASEPHHHLTFENGYARLFAVIVAPHEATLLHQHDCDYVFVPVGNGKFTSSAPGKPDAVVTLKDGAVHFSRGGFAHVAANSLDAPFRTVTIEFLHPQGKARNLCEVVIEHEPLDCLAGGAKKRAPSGYWVAPDFETEEARVSSVRIDPKGKFPAKSEFDQLVVALAESEVEVSVGGEPRKKLRTMDSAWIPRDVPREIRNASKSGARVLVIEFLDSAPKK